MSYHFFYVCLLSLLSYYHVCWTKSLYKILNIPLGHQTIYFAHNLEWKFKQGNADYLEEIIRDSIYSFLI